MAVWEGLVEGLVIASSSNTNNKQMVTNHCCHPPSNLMVSATERKEAKVRSTKTRKKTSSLQDQFLRSNLDLILIGIFFAVYSNWILVDAASEEPVSDISASNTTNATVAPPADGTIDNSSMAPYSILFPW